MLSEDILSRAKARFKHTAQAAGLLLLKETRDFAEAAAESGYTVTEFPAYDDIDLYSHNVDQVVTLFYDLRKSTERMYQIGADGTYVLSMTLLPALAEAVLYYNGFIVDYPGDGIMAMWGFESKGVERQLIKGYCSKALDCAYVMAKATEAINHELFSRIQLSFKTNTAYSTIGEVKYGIGVAHGPVIISKVGMTDNNRFVQAKAIGPSVHEASKLSEGIAGRLEHSILIAKQTRDLYTPSTSGRPPKYIFDSTNSHKLNRVNLPENIGY